MNLDKQALRAMVVIYVATFACVLLALTLFPPARGYYWEPAFINGAISMLFALLVVLTINLLRLRPSLLNALLVSLFLVVFCPGGDNFFIRDESSLMELSSQCMVPFFINQYNRVSRKTFRWWYFLMLLMGIFCSYTHNGITVPLCLTFIWLSFRRRQFFRRACWPMVIGFVIGTGISLWRMTGEAAIDASLMGMTTTTASALTLLWDTKVFILALVLAGYLHLLPAGRRILHYLGRRNMVVNLCLLMSLISLPLAPLGLENATTGVCFFSMLWMLTVIQFILRTNIKTLYNNAVRKD